jgi:hypothetical protein
LIEGLLLQAKVLIPTKIVAEPVKPPLGDITLFKRLLYSINAESEVRQSSLPRSY